MTNLPLCLPPTAYASRSRISLYMEGILHKKVGNINVFLLLENKRNILLTIVYLLLLACTKMALIF